MDERLRILERAAPHDPVAAARLVRELLRMGRIELATLELAANLTHEPSLGALDLSYRELGSPEELQTWTKGLAQFGMQPLVRAAVVAGELGVRSHERAGGGPGPRHALEAARRFSERPTEENRTTALAVAVTCGRIAGANAGAGLWACWCAADHLESLAPTYAAYAASCALFSVRSVAVVQATISRSLIAWALDGVPVPRTLANKARPAFVSWTLTD